MGRHDEVVGLSLEHAVEQRRVALGDAVGVDAALAGLLELDVRAQVRPCGVVELQVARARVVEGLHRVAVRLHEVVDDRFAAVVERAVDVSGLEAEVEHGRRRDAELRGRPGRAQPSRSRRDRKCSRNGCSGEKPIGPSISTPLGLVCTPWNWMPWSSSTMSTPSRNPKKSKCHHERRNSPSVASCSPASRLAHDEIGDRGILDLGEGVGVDRPFGVFGTGALEGLGAQETADDVGAVRGNDAHRSIVSPVPAERWAGVIVGHLPLRRPASAGVGGRG